MADQVVQLPTDGTNTGRKVDVSELTVGANTVERQRMNIGDPTNATSLAAVKAASTAVALTDPALAVAESPNSPIVALKLRNLGAAVAVKASAGTLFGVQIVNNQAALVFIQIFFAAVGSVTLGTTTPDLEFQVAANSSGSLSIPSRGINATTAITIASTTTEGGATASAAGVQGFVQYV